MGHWAMAKGHPGGEAINPELMARRDFPYPHSTPGAIAIKAFAAQLPEREGDFLEAVERTHLVECLNIDDTGVLVAAAERLGAEPSIMREVMADQDMEKRVWADHIEALNAGAPSTPTVDFSGKYRITGAQPMEVFNENLRACRGRARGRLAPPCEEAGGSEYLSPRRRRFCCLQVARTSAPSSFPRRRRNQRARIKTAP